MSTLKTVLRAAALTVALGTAAFAPQAHAANVSGFHGGGGLHGGGFYGGGLPGGGVRGSWFHGGGVHTGWHGGHGLHRAGHDHWRGNVRIVDPGWYGYDGYDAQYTDDSYNPYCDPDSADYDPDYCPAD